MRALCWLMTGSGTSGEPVKAQADRLFYRSSKFVLRHRTGAAVAAGVVLAVEPRLAIR